MGRANLPVYNLKIDAEDGKAGSDLSMRSGVKDIQIFLDQKEEEEDVPWEAQGCGGPSHSCPMTVTYPFELTGLDSGKHTLKVIAIDQLGHKRERAIEFEYIPATGIKDEYVMHYFPLPDGQGNEEEEEHPVRPELAVNVINGNLVYRQHDIDVEGPAVDLEVERFYNSQLPESEDTEWGDGWTLAQTPELDPEEVATPKEADLLDSSGTIEGGVQLPTEVGKSQFDPELQATLTREAGGGYELADESGETETALAFDKAGKAQELRTDAWATVDYDYEKGMLTEIAVEDPGSTSDVSEAAEAPFPEPKEAEEAPAPEGLVAAYSFDEGAGWLAYDDSGNGHDGELMETSWTSEGKHGGALDFGADLSMVIVPDAAELDFAEEFTLEAWVRPDSLGERSPIFAKGYEPRESNYRLDAGPEEGPPLAGATDQNEEEATVEGTEALPPKAWSHLAATFDGEELSLYVDGEEVASEVAEGPWADGAELQIGGDWLNWAFFDGRIDDVRLYDRALGAEEIEADRDTPVKATRGLVAAWPFEDGPEEEEAHDLTGAHDGTIAGADWTMDGRYGGALAFDGKDDLLTIPASKGLAFADDFTLEAWVRPEETSGRASVIAKEASGSVAYQLLAKNPLNRPAGYLAGPKGEATAQAGSALALNTWSHLAVTSNGVVMTLYVNGKGVGSASAGPPSTAEGPLQVGGNLLQEADFKGKIDEVRLYNRILTEPEIKGDKEAPIVDPPAEPAPAEDDPAVDVVLDGSLVESVEGAETGETEYGHEGDLLTSVDGPDGETSYDYDAQGRMTKVTLPNGTWGGVVYREDGRVKSVTIQPAEGEEQTTFFSYSDEPRRTTVTPEGAPAVRYDVGADGSVFKWQNVQKPPVFDNLGGSIYFNKEKELPGGAQVLDVIAHSEEGIASIKVLTSGTNLADEATCDENLETEEIECKAVESQWVMETENFAPGRLDIEVIVEDPLGEMAAERFWVNIPQPPPPTPDGAPTRPKFSDIEHFRDEFGLDIVDPVSSEKERNARVFNLIHAWIEGEPIARSSAERWGVPLRAKDIAELEYREWYYDVNTNRIDQWVEETQPSSFGGYYIDHAAGGIMHIGFLDNQAEQLASLKTSLSLAGGERLQVYPVAPAASYLSVRATAQSVLGAIESNPTLADLVVSVEDDEAGKATRVGTPHVVQVEGILDQMLGAGAPVTVEYEAGGGALLEGRYRNGGRMRAGDYINSDFYAFEGIPTGGPCTAGFGAEDRRPSANGGEIVRLFLLTAGHCAVKIDEEVWRAPQDESQDFDDAGKSEVGRIRRSALQYYELGGVRTDGAAIRIKEGGIVPQAIWGWGGHALPAKPAGKARKGNVVCYSGALSKNVSCGKIVARSLNWHPEGAPIGLSGYWVRFPEGRRPVKGDSGSPVWNPRTGASIGLVSAGRPQGSLDETLVAPLLHPPNMPANRVPGILHHQGMEPLRLKLGG